MRFNTAFLLIAAAVTALCCLPMALDRESGFVWTAFLLPIGLATLAATQVEGRGKLEFRIEQLSESVVQVGAVGGPLERWMRKCRVVAAGCCLAIVFGFPSLHQIDPEPPEFWGPIAAMFGLMAIALVGYSTRCLVLTDERAFVRDHLVFGRPCWRRRRWQVGEGDHLAVLLSFPENLGGKTESTYWHALFVYRGRSRQLITKLYSREADVPEMELGAERVARLVELPYEGYWWPT
jgi:hypothetical protein